MDAILNLFVLTLDQVITSLIHNWPFLIVSILISAGLTLYLDPQKVSAFLIRHRRAGVVGATVAAVGTPLCSCGTTAVLLGMMATGLLIPGPWGKFDVHTLLYAFVAIAPLLSVIALSARHGSSVPSKDLMDVLAPLVQLGLGLLKQITQQFKVRQTHVELRERPGQSRPFLR